MLDCVDGEAFTRRRALKTIALASVAGLPAVAAGNALPGTAINHVSYSSIDSLNTERLLATVSVGLAGWLCC
jgi:hypothetical protein